MSILVLSAERSFKCMESRLGSTVAIHVTSRRDLEGTMNRLMTNELLFQITMQKADEFLSSGLITLEQYKTFRAKMETKYSPFISQLIDL